MKAPKFITCLICEGRQAKRIASGEFTLRDGGEAPYQLYRCPTCGVFPTFETQEEEGEDDG